MILAFEISCSCRYQSNFANTNYVFIVLYDLTINLYFNFHIYISVIHSQLICIFLFNVTVMFKFNIYCFYNPSDVLSLSMIYPVSQYQCTFTYWTNEWMKSNRPIQPYYILTYTRKRYAELLVTYNNGSKETVVTHWPYLIYQIAGRHTTDSCFDKSIIKLIYQKEIICMHTTERCLNKINNKTNTAERRLTHKLLFRKNHGMRSVGRWAEYISIILKLKLYVRISTKGV
jgi:hypothetical protein